MVGLLLLVAGALIWTAWPPPYDRKSLHMVAVVTAPFLGCVFVFTGWLLRTTTRRGLDALAGPARELFLILIRTRIDRNQVRTTLRRDPDQRKPDVTFKRYSSYSASRTFNQASGARVTVLGTLRPGTSAIVLTDAGAWIGRVDYCVEDVARLRTSAAGALAPSDREELLRIARSEALRPGRLSFEARVYLWFGTFMIGVIPGVALAHEHHAVLGWTINGIVLSILAVIRWRYRKRKRGRIGF